MALITNTVNTTNPLGTVTGYDPEKIKLDDADTVAGQVKKITAAGSPLITQAETAAKQDANKRGLLNSSMAVEAGQSAVYRTALPIASQDAATSMQAKTLNQGASNAASSQTAAATNAAESQLLSGNQNLQAINAQTEGSKALIGAQTAATKEINTQQNTAALEQQRQQFQQQLELAQKSGDITAARDAQLQLFNLQSQQQQQANTERLAQIQQENAVALKNLDTAAQTALQQMTQQNQQILQNNASAVNLYGATMQNISAIGSNPDLTPAQRQAGIDQAITMLKSGLDLAGATESMDLPIFTGTEAGGSLIPAAPAANTNQAKIDDLMTQYKAEVSNPRRNTYTLNQLRQQIISLGGTV